MSNKFEVEFNYNTAEAGRQDQLMLRPLKDFLFTPVSVEKDEEYRCVTVGITSDVASGVHIVNALQESVRLLDEKGVKLTSTVYAMGTSLDIETPLTVDQASLMKLKDLTETVKQNAGVEVVPFNGGVTVNFDTVAKYEQFKNDNEKSLKELEASGVKVADSPVRNHLYEVSNYSTDKKIGSAFGA